MGKRTENDPQITLPKNCDLETSPMRPTLLPNRTQSYVNDEGSLTTGNRLDGLRQWVERYFDNAVTTCKRTRKEQLRDLNLFLGFMILVNGNDFRPRWTPRLSEEFRAHLIDTLNGDGSRRWGDRAVNRILYTLKTFAKWVHRFHTFPLGDPMENIRAARLANPLEIERALTKNERNRLLDAADDLPKNGGRSKCRRRYVNKEERPVRKGYRPYRNRAIIYTLVETGMRRNAVTSLNIADIDYDKQSVTVMEKGRLMHTYQISKKGLEVINEYIQHERGRDLAKKEFPALFLSACTNPNGKGRLSAAAINEIWNDICKVADIKGRTPHSARHAMGRWIIEDTGNVEAVQRQLGHRNAAYSMLYSRITTKELNTVLDKRNHQA